jgi:hypothetical protein
MARKQTLKSLLGGSDSRVQTDLALDEVSFAAPRIQAGNYGVRVQDTPSTNTAGQIADALGEFAGPVLNQYKSLEKQKQEEYAEIAKVLSPEQAKAVSSGDISSVEASLGKTADKLNTLQRKRLLKFVDNPNNYRLGANVVGTKVAGQYGLDLMDNIESYARSDKAPEEQFQEVRNKLIENNELQGHALVGFMAEAARQEERFAPRIIAMQNERTEQTFISNSMQALRLDIEQSDYSQFGKNFSEYFAGYTPDEQATYLTELVGGVIDANDFHEAEELIGWLVTADDGIKVGGNANLSDGVINQLTEKITAERQRIERVEQAEVTKQRTDITEAITSTFGFIGAKDKPEKITVDIAGVPTDIPTGDNKLEVLTNYRAVVAGSDMSETEKGMHYNEILKLTTLEEDRLNTTYNKSSIPHLVSGYRDSLNTDVEGQNYLGMDTDAILDKVTGLEDELKEGVDAIYADNETYKTSGEKQQAAQRLTQRRSLELKQELNTMQNDYNASVRVEKTLTSVGMGIGGNYNTQITKSLSAWFSDMDGGPEAINSLRDSTVEGLQTSVRNIIGAPFTDEERKDLPKAIGDRNRTVNNLVQDSLASVEKAAEVKYNEMTVVTVEDNEEVKEESTPPLVISSTIENALTMPEGFNPTKRSQTEEGRDWLKLRRTRKKLQDKRDLINNPEAMYQRAVTGSKQYPVELEDVTGQYLRARDNAFDYRAGVNILFDGEVGVKWEELESGHVHGLHHVDTSKLSIETAKKVPMLSLDLLINPNTENNLATLKEYARVLNIDFNDENEMDKLLTYQYAVFKKEYGVNFHK